MSLRPMFGYTIRGYRVTRYDLPFNSSVCAVYNCSQQKELPFPLSDVSKAGPVHLHTLHSLIPVARVHGDTEQVVAVVQECLRYF